jgi:hypothetical protein
MSSTPLLDDAQGVGAWGVRVAGGKLAVCGLGGRMCWYSLNVAVDVFSRLFGASVYPQMLFVYNAGATVGLVLQVLYDARLDAQYGIKSTFFVRYAAGLVVLIAIQLVVASVRRQGLLLLLCTVAGYADYYAGGTLTQIAGMYGGTPAAVFIGQSSCGILLLAYTLATGFGGDTDTSGGATLYFMLCSACSASALIVFCLFWWRDPCALSIVSRAEANRVKPHRASTVALEMLSDLLAKAVEGERECSGRSSEASIYGDGNASPRSPNVEMLKQRHSIESDRLLANEKMMEEVRKKEWMVLKRAARSSWMLQLAIMMQWVAMLGVQSYFTLIRCASSSNTDPSGGAAADSQQASTMNQQLVYVNMFALAVGQWLPDWLPHLADITQGRLLAASASMLAISLPAVNVYVAGGVPLISRWEMCAVMSLFYSFGAGLWMLDYRFVSTMEAELQPPTIRLLNLSLEIGILLGIAASSMQHEG